MIYLVMKNGHPHAVFSNRPAAENHAKNLASKWSFTSIIEMEVYDI